MNWFFNMPIEFQIGSIVAVAFLVFSLLSSLFRRRIATYITLLISFLSCVIHCHLPTMDFGTHIAITLIAYGFIWFLIRQFIKVMVKAQLEAEWKLYSSDFECVSADPSEFTWLDLDYYDTTQRELESLGFQKVGDYELLPQTRAFPETRTFSRQFINEEQDIGASIINMRVVKPKNLFERSINRRIVEFSSEFSDGTILDTNNTRGVNPIVEIDGIELVMFESTISLEKLLDAHEERMEAICETKEVDVVVFRNASEMLAANEREFLLFRKDRKEKGGFTESEIAENVRLASSYLISDKDDEEGIKIYLAEYNRQARKRRKKQEDEFSQS
jgi:hypothetical protein